MEDLGADWMIILKRILNKKGRECVDWIHLDLDCDQWWDLVNTV
jgi:hypothetical protein